MINFILKIICKIFGHVIDVKGNEYDSEMVNKCKRCKMVLDIIENKYKIKCVISKKVQYVPLVKMNKKTIIINYKGNNIKRHILKHEVIIREV